jgi:hypothetical protein
MADQSLSNYATMSSKEGEGDEYIYYYLVLTKHSKRGMNERLGICGFTPKNSRHRRCPKYSDTWIGVQARGMGVGRSYFLLKFQIVNRTNLYLFNFFNL